MDTPTPQSYPQTSPPVTPLVTPAPAPASPRPRSNKGIIAAVVVSALLIGGYLAWAMSADSWPFAPTVQPILSPSPSATADPTAGWKTYRSLNFGYSLKHPLNWGSAECRLVDGGHLYLYPGSGARTNVECLGSDQRPFINPIELSEFKQYQTRLPRPTETKSSLTIDGQPAIKFTSVQTDSGGMHPVGTTFIVVYTSNGTAAYAISFDVPPNSPTQLLIREQILSTFKFTSTDPTAGWKTYTNTEFGFQLTFTDEWAGYYVLRHAVQRSDFPSGAVFDAEFEKQKGIVTFSFDMKDKGQDYTMFAVTAYPKAWWLEVKDEPIIARSYLGEQAGFVFLKSTPQESPQDPALLSLVNKGNQVLSTFKFTK